MTQVYRHLVPYPKTLSNDAQDRGTPLQRPLFMQHEDDPRCYSIQDRYLCGPDLLVAQSFFAADNQWTELFRSVPRA